MAIYLWEASYISQNGPNAKWDTLPASLLPFWDRSVQNEAVNDTVNRYLRVISARGVQHKKDSRNKGNKEEIPTSLLLPL